MLSSQGEPLVASPGPAGGPPIMSTPELVNLDTVRPGNGVRFADKYAFRLTDASGRSIKGSDASDEIALLPRNPTRNLESKITETTQKKIEKAIKDGKHTVPSDDPQEGPSTPKAPSSFHEPSPTAQETTARPSATKPSAH